MKTIQAGMMIAVLAMWTMAGLANAADAVEETPANPAPAPVVSNPETTPAPVGAPAPASMEKIKQKLETINAGSPEGVEGIVKMYRAGVDKVVIDAYIRNSRLAAPTPRDLIYLHDQGLPQELVTALIEHGKTTPAATASSATAPAPATESGASLIAAPGTTYNNYVNNTLVPGSSSPSTVDVVPAASTGSSSSVLIIPYNPYRNYYQSYYSTPFYGPYYYPTFSYYGYGYGPSWYYSRPFWGPSVGLRFSFGGRSGFYGHHGWRR